ncbi:MAG: DNA repair protein RadA [Armatimonadetes bacterium]|nr:DNA repair protein RadA [Armatimonadota bacterium]
MIKLKNNFVCQECGAIFVKWQGKCSECNAWNSLQENLALPKNDFFQKQAASQLISEIFCQTEERLTTFLKEFDRVLGGGIVKGSLILIGGIPGIGKSTLLLDIAGNISKNSKRVLYVSGEESLEQIKLRAIRLSINNNFLYLLSETNLNFIEEEIEKIKPDLVVIDSIQTIFHPDFNNTPGSVSQVRECTLKLMRLGKNSGLPILLVGHVTKDGALAGPKVLEHIVDTVLYFEGENLQQFRILRSMKNRFGSTNEIGIFEMCESGLKEIFNLSQFFLEDRKIKVPGSVIIPVIEGSKPILIELQTLVARSFYGMPTRRSSGVEINRLNLILAVLEKRGNFNLGNCDVFTNIVGGIQVDEPAIDLGLALALASGIKDKPLNQDMVVLGELGLGGEVRAITQIEKRIKEAQKLGFKKCILPKSNFINLNLEIELIPVTTLKEALEWIK